jgi:hypothetical protein
MTTTTTRAQYLALFDNTAAAIEFEEQCLAIGESRPACADAVKAGLEPTPDYWAWLAAQLQESQRDQSIEGA